MPPAKPPEFRRRAIALARAGDQSIARIAADLGIAESPGRTSSQNGLPGRPELAADGFPVSTACRVLQVSASGFYDWLDREPSARSAPTRLLTETIAAAHAASYGTYGARRVHAELRLAWASGSAASGWSG